MRYKFSNKAVARLLREIAAVYEINNENAFKIRAYENSADSIERLSGQVKEVWEEGELKSLPGIGPRIESYLNELFTKGRVAHFDEVKKGMPRGMFALLEVPNIGAKTAFKLSKHFKLNDPKAAITKLKKAALEGKIRVLEGFGEESEKKILKGISDKEKLTSRMLLYVADVISENLLQYLKKSEYVINADALGSLRRRVPTVGDIDIAVSTDNSKGVIDYFVRYPKVYKVVSKGDVKATILLETGEQIDLMTQKPDSYGSLLQHFTGSKAHNIHLREYAQERGLSLSEHGIRKGLRRLKFESETAFYNYLVMQYIPPEIREDTGEIGAAVENKLPSLIELKDIKGDLQMHTTLSDGEDSLMDMIKACEKKEYKYIGITDHQESINTKSKESIKALIRTTRRIIEQYNSSHKRPRVLYGVEVSILARNELAYTRELLSLFDFAIGAIHTGFDQSKERITNRLLTAIENPFIKIIAHPSGRILGEREPYSVNWEEIFLACKKYNKVLEINAYPTRLDLPDTLVREGLKYGVKMAINTDSHSISDLDCMKYGVWVARRGWCEKRHIINTWDLKDVIALFGKSSI